MFEKSTCTNPNKKHCSRVDQYPTQLIDLSLGDGGPKTNAQIVITIELQTSEQPSGVVALVETALIEGPCEDSTLEMIDPCFDMDFPCNSDYCVQSGVLTLAKLGLIPEISRLPGLLGDQGC